MRTVVSALVPVLVLSCSLSVSAQTRELLDAPLVEGHIKIQWDAAAKKFMYAVDDSGVFRELKPNMLFLTKTSIFVTYHRINPLQLVASGSVTGFEDPSAEIIKKLIEGLASVATTVGAAGVTGGAAAAAATASGIAAPAGGVDASTAKPVVPSACQAFDTAYLHTQRLDAALFGPATTPAAIKTSVEQWARAITDGYAAGRSGTAAIGEGAAAIAVLAATLQTATTQGGEVLTDIEAAEKAIAAGAGPCITAAKQTYMLIRIANPRARMDQLKAIRAAAIKVKDALVADYAEGKWIGAVNFKVTPEIGPTPAEGQEVALKASRVLVKVDEVSGALSVAQEDAGSLKFKVRRYSRLVPEVGLGGVFGFIKTTEYATTTNAAGQTVVGIGKEKEVTIAPSILVNFACRCELGPFMTPMLQVGAVASKDLPGFLVGGGLRLFGAGKGDIALGGGLMVAWIKDLQTLKPGDVVTGTKEIVADYKFNISKPQARPYVLLRSKF